VTPQCHLGLFLVLTQEPSFHVSQIEHEAPNQLKNKRSTKFIAKRIMSNTIEIFKRGENVETLIPTLIKLFK
jgi:transcriptional regulator